ncbi:MAG TPA: bifunctional oligoribonuclease/PAP phosphatase NrnA [Bacteroidota bacterium]|nr:bifunctional oligoribonuclease/PAP phosphatase NrnA [Bacteroidota bacterium]
MPIQFETFRQIIESHQRFLLTTHINPDGDGLGTEVALALYLQKLGKQATILNCSATPYNYLFLDKLFPIQHFQNQTQATLIDDAEVILVIDTNHLDRVAAMKSYVENSKALKICIDHHLDPAEFADIYILDEPSSATGEIVYRLLSYLNGRTIDRETAIALYTAIMTDTGGFRYPRTSPEVHKIIANLIQMGADPVAIHEFVYERGQINRLQLLGMALATLQLAHDGKVAYMILTKHMFEVTHTSEVDTDAFVPYTLSIDGVKVGLMFTEMDHGIKINFRSKGDIWINQLAKEFGGNGHKNAAGARIADGTLEEYVPQIIDHAGAYTP